MYLLSSFCKVYIASKKQVGHQGFTFMLKAFILIYLILKATAKLEKNLYLCGCKTENIRKNTFYKPLY